MRCILSKIEKFVRPLGFEPRVFCARGGTRTPDRSSISRLLYQLSYARVSPP
jgi:hypothetical protein